MISAFVDNADLWKQSSVAGVRIDYKKLKHVLGEKFRCLRYYTSQREEDKQRRRLFYVMLAANGYSVHPLVCTEIGQYTTAVDCPTAQGLPKEVLLDMFGAFHLGHRNFILVAGGGEYADGVTRLRNLGASVKVVFPEQHCSRALFDAASAFVHLDWSAIGREEGSSHHHDLRIEQSLRRLKQGAI